MVDDNVNNIEMPAKKTRFASTSEEQQKKILSERLAKSTQKSTESKLRLFQSYLTEKSLPKEEEIPDEDLPDTAAVLLQPQNQRWTNLQNQQSEVYQSWSEQAPEVLQGYWHCDRCTLSQSQWDVWWDQSWSKKVRQGSHCVQKAHLQAWHGANLQLLQLQPTPEARPKASPRICHLQHHLLLLQKGKREFVLDDKIPLHHSVWWRSKAAFCDPEHRWAWQKPQSRWSRCHKPRENVQDTR